MKVAHVLRKPCSEGTVDANVASRFFKQFGGDKVHGDPSDG